MTKVLLTLFICSCTYISWAQRTITGKVTSTDGSPIPGVNVVVEQTTNGAVTNADGEYAMTVDGSAVLVFTFIGFETQKVAVGAQSRIDIQMREDIQQLSEVVVTGLNIPRERGSIGYSVSEVDGGVVSQVNQTNFVELSVTHLKQWH